MEIAKIYLKKDKERSLLRKHRWVFSGAIKTLPEYLEEGTLVEVRSHQDKFLAKGFWGKGSISVRVLSFVNEDFNQHFWNNRIKSAYDSRKNAGVVNNEQTNLYRLIHGEGDALPGLIIDLYESTAVIQTHSAGYEPYFENIQKAIQNAFGSTVVNFYIKPHFHSASHYLGKSNASKGIAKENSISFYIDWEKGQKTGFFIDQRDNRELLGRLSKGKSVLNTFCYTGGFSLYALKHGASQVVSVDSSALAIEQLEENLSLNGLKNKKHTSIKADVLEYLKEEGNQYDIIVLDPPAFAKHMSAKHKAVQAYKRLNAQAMKHMKKGGLLFTFSCSQVVDKGLFNGAITAAAIEADRTVRVLHQLHQPADHPINIFHPETEYLKGLVLLVE
ncbi:MAG: class I SAM-dependent rRNA methyltransferase [Flavobacteriales bacterium]